MNVRSTAPRPVELIRSGIGPSLPVPSTATVIDLFEATAARVPDRPAVRFRQHTRTFGQLNEEAEALACRLRDRGVGIGDFVPLVITEGIEFPVGLLAAMKAGAPFVPIDPNWPLSRLAELFRQLSPRVILTVTATMPLLDRLGLADRVQLVDRMETSEQTLDRPAPGPDDLIYGYFTSGSTGTPKCALNRHHGLVNRLAVMSHHFGDGADHVVLQNSKPTFDSAMWQLLWPLTTGGLVVLPDRRGILDLTETCHILSRHGVTITDFVPSVLGELVGLLELRPDLRAELAGLRRMLIGGEEANGGVLARLWELLPGLKVTNTFGPTECSIGSVFHDITEATGRIPLGRPIPNTAAVVLDDERHPVPAGTVGEIYIGGRCVGAGYLGDPERTARAFVPNPFAEISGDLLYRTGDLGHYTPDGLLMFDGRRDDQVKVGGVRIELAEVQRMLGTHPAVHAAAVIVRGTGDARSLAAFVTLRPGAAAGCGADGPATVTPALLLDWLGGLLPPETVPRFVAIVDEIPLTPHGKLDRRALEQMLQERTGSGPAEPPATAAEELVASAWREVLGRTEVSVTVPFADYGGTSLLAHRLSALLGVRHGRPLSLATLLTADTVRAQAGLLDTAPSADGTPVDASLLARDTDPGSLVGPDVPAPPATARRILLTGVTGFIGAHVLAELITRRPEVELHCLVRAADAAAGADRLAAALRGYGLSGPLAALPSALADGRVHVVVGDLAAPALGLGDAGFRALATTVDAVVHAGALVNFLRDYAGHRAPNVLGTGELIRLAAMSTGCRLHVLSTFSVFSTAARRGSATAVGPDRMPGLELLPEGGYDQSKLVVEHLLARARPLGVDSVVYRLGEIWPHRRTGRPNPASLAHSVVYAAARTGVVFPTTARTDHLPVDVLAQHLAGAAVGTVPPVGHTVHLLRPGGLAYAEIFAGLAEAGAEPLGYPEFRARLAKLAEADDADERLVRVAMLLPEPDAAGLAAPIAFDRLFTDNTRHFTTAGPLRHQPGGAPLADLAAFLGRLDVAR